MRLAVRLPFRLRAYLKVFEAVEGQAQVVHTKAVAVAYEAVLAHFPDRIIIKAYH